MDAENISNDGCSQRDSAEHKGYVRAHRSFNRIWKERDSAQSELWEKILDKDNMLPEIERLDEKQTWFAGAPSEEEFDGMNREFWWVLKTFAEYTLRKELPSAMFYLNVAVRDLLNQMIRWHLFLQAGQPIDMGILDCNMEKLLDRELFSLYKKTYPAADYEQIWKAFDAVVRLWTAIGKDVAEHCGYAYPTDTEKNMLSMIRSMKG